MTWLLVKFAPKPIGDHSQVCVGGVCEDRTFYKGVFGCERAAGRVIKRFSHFSCVLAYKIFGDLASGKICPETNWRPSVSIRGSGTRSTTKFNGIFGHERGDASEIRRFSHFSCVLAHKYFGDSAFGKICPETNWRPFVGTWGRRM